MNVFFKLTSNIFTVTTILGLTTACGSAIIPMSAPGSNGPDARGLMHASYEAHGGRAWDEVNDLSVSYAGEWLSIVRRLQPVLSDSGYRATSEERYLLKDEVIAQSHVGPEGTKYVFRTRDEISVWYDGESTTDPEVLAASALVADAYEMFITGPRFFLVRDAKLEKLGMVTLNRSRYEAVLATLRPGFGLSEEDRAIIYLDPERKTVERVRFTLNGLKSTRGAEVDVVFDDHREIEGILWPTRFYERVESPVSLPAHRWTLQGLEINRSLTPSDLEGPELSGNASLPAGSGHRAVH